MRRPAIVFLAALGLAGWVGADAAARPNDSKDAVMPRREARTGDVVVQRSAASANVVVVDGGTQGQAADGIADRVFVLQRDGRHRRMPCSATPGRASSSTRGPSWSRRRTAARQWGSSSRGARRFPRQRRRS